MSKSGRDGSETVALRTNGGVAERRIRALAVPLTESMSM